MSNWLRFCTITCALTICLLQGCVSPKVTVDFQPSISSSRGQAVRVAVMPFSNAEGKSRTNYIETWQVPPNNGETVASILAEALIKVPNYKVLERSKLNSILDEYGLSAAEFIERKGASELGRLLQADAIVIGSTHRFCQVRSPAWRADIAFTARCIDVSTGEIIWSASPSCKRPGFVIDYVRQYSQQIAKQVSKKITGPN